MRSKFKKELFVWLKTSSNGITIPIPINYNIVVQIKKMTNKIDLFLKLFDKFLKIEMKFSITIKFYRDASNPLHVYDHVLYRLHCN